jgi:hypothetical protein
MIIMGSVYSARKKSETKKPSIVQAPGSAESPISLTARRTEKDYIVLDVSKPNQ